MVYLKYLSTDGDTHLGGDDVDEKIISWLADEFKAEEKIWIYVKIQWLYNV